MRPVACISDALKCDGGGLGKLHGEAVGAEVAPEVLAKQHLDIRFIVDDENEQTQAVLPISARECRRSRQDNADFGEFAGL